MSKVVHSEMHGGNVELPTEVREQATTKTSVYCQGELVYDGATGKSVGSGAVSAGPEPTLNGMLKWGIEHSDPDELKRRAAAGTAPPTQIDKEIIDMLLGEPTVAKMRECLAKLESPALNAKDGLDSGAAALEELEYYVEDLDNAVDLTKIRGLPILMACCAYGLPPSTSETAASADEAAAVSAAVAAAEADPDGCAAVREGACGALAAMLQNNPKVQQAARAAGVPAVLLRLLGGLDVQGDGWEDRVGGVVVVRKALLAMSALLRSNSPSDAEDAAEAAATLLLSLPRLGVLAGHSDAKLRRRALFLFAALGEAPSTAIAAFAVASARDSALPTALIAALATDDEDTRTQAERFLLAASKASTAAGDAAVRAAALKLGVAIAGGGGSTAVEAAEAAAVGGVGDPDASSRLRAIRAWLTALVAAVDVA